MKTKAQSSLEFLAIFGISFMIIILLGGIFFTYSSGAKTNLDKKQLERIGDEIVSNVEQIYFLGDGNRVTIQTKFPDDIVNMTIYHKNQSGLSFDYLTFTHYNDDILVESSFEPNDYYVRFNCTNCHHVINGPDGNLSFYNQSDFAGGTKSIRIESYGDYVAVDFYNE